MILDFEGMKFMKPRPWLNIGVCMRGEVCVWMECMAGSFELMQSHGCGCCEVVLVQVCLGVVDIGAVGEDRCVSLCAVNEP